MLLYIVISSEQKKFYIVRIRRTNEIVPIPVHTNHGIQRINLIIKGFLKPKKIIKLENIEEWIMFSFL